MAGHAAHGTAFEDVEVHLLVMGLGREGTCALGVPQHQIGVGANADGAFAWEQVEDLRRIGGGDGNEFVHGQATCVHTGIPQHRHAVLDAGRAIGNAAEVVASHGLLLGAETAMVGGGGVQVARLQAAPQRLLVFTRSERRAHHIARCRGPVRVAVDAVVQQQVARQDLAVYRLPLAASVGNFVQRLAAGDMHQVQRRTKGFGNTDGAAGRFALDLGWA